MGLNEAEALAGPVRFFFGFDYGENDWVCVDVWRFRDRPPNALQGWGAKQSKLCEIFTRWVGLELLIRVLLWEERKPPVKLGAKQY